MAATLLDIKSRMLLPAEVDEDGEEVDPRTELVEKLLEYKMYKFMSYELREREEEAAGAMYRKFGILALEMEAAGLYWTAQRLGKRALAILTISDHIFTGEALTAQERQDSFHEMMEIALETAWHSLEG